MQRIDPAIQTLIRHGIREGLINLRREKGWLVSFGALFGITLLLQIALATFLGMQGIQSTLHARTDLRLEIQPGASDQEIREFLSAIQQQTYVEEVIYITKEQAYERTKKTDPELIAFLEEYDLDNPFADAAGVVLKNLKDYDTFAKFTNSTAWATVIDPTFLSEVSKQEEYVYELIQLTSAGRSVASLILAITLVVLLCTTTELVRRRTLVHNDEILIERLVGAHSLAVIVPFATEAAALLMGSMILSGVVVIVIVNALPTFVTALSSTGVLADVREQVYPLIWGVLPLCIIVELLLSPIIALAGTWLGLRAKITSSTLSIRSS